MKSIQLILISGVFLLLPTLCLADDWKLPVIITAGPSGTSVVIGVQDGATNGYDAGKDAPAPSDNSGVLLYAGLPHPEWGVVIGSIPADYFSQDIRGTLPQTFDFEVRTTQPDVTLSWKVTDIPPRLNMILSNSVTGEWVDMTQEATYTFRPGSSLPEMLQIIVSRGDIAPPATPTGVTVENRGDTLYVAWKANSEPDLSGYKVTYSLADGTGASTFDVKKSTNYSLFNLKVGQKYAVSVSAYDNNDNVSGRSPVIAMQYGLQDLNPVAAPRNVSVHKSGSGLVASWVKNRERDVIGYRVYLGPDAKALSLAADVGLTRRYSVPVPAAGKTVVIGVKAYNKGGNESVLATSTWTTPIPKNKRK